MRVAFGIEIDRELIAKATGERDGCRRGDRVSFVEDDLFTADLSQATVVTIYLLKRATMKLRDRLFELRPGTRIVSHAASMGEWRADHFEMLDVKDKVRPDAPGKTYIHYWVVPAKVGGHWRWSVNTPEGEQACELRLVQQFQALSGSLRVGEQEYAIEDGKLDGRSYRSAHSEAAAGTGVRYQLSGRGGGCLDHRYIDDPRWRHGAQDAIRVIVAGCSALSSVEGPIIGDDMKTAFIVVAAAGLIAAGGAYAQSGAEVVKSKCAGCHDMEAKKVGSSWKDIAAKHKGNKDAAPGIVTKLKEGKGHMKVAASDAELNAAVQYILAVK